MSTIPTDSLGTSFEAALGSVGTPISPLAGLEPPPPQETIELVLSSKAIFAAQQTLIEVDKDLMALGEKLHTLETLLARHSAFSPETLTRKQLQNLVQGGPDFVNVISTEDLAAIQAAANAVEHQIRFLQIRALS